MDEFVDLPTLLAEAEQELLAVEKAMEAATDDTIRRNREVARKLCQEKVDQLRSAFVENQKNLN